MPPYLIFIPIVLITIGIVFSIIMNKKSKAHGAEINMEDERRQYKDYKTELLDGKFSFLKEWMKGGPIDAFTSASIPVSGSQKAKDFLLDTAKNMALSVVSIRYNSVETDCYLVLSGSELHFFGTDVDGELDEYYIFDTFRLDKGFMEFKGAKNPDILTKQTNAKAYLPNIYLLSFNMNSKIFSLEIHDRLKTNTSVQEMLTGKYFKEMVKHQVVGEVLVKELMKRFNNLKIN
jgi:hypothetical protein